MNRCHWIMGLAVGLAVLGSRLTGAAETDFPAGPFQLEAGVGPAEPPVVGGMPPPPPLPPPTFVERETPRPTMASESSQWERASGLLTLGDLEQTALESNPTLMQARMAVQAAEGGYVQAGVYPNPGVGYAGEDVGIVGTAGQQGVVFSQEIVTGGKRRLGRAVASHEVQQARHAWETQRARVLNDVRMGYYEVLLAQKMIDVNREMVRIGEEGLRAATALEAADEVSQWQVLQARIEAETVTRGLNEAEVRRRAAWRRLVGLLGCPEMERADLAGDVDKGLPQYEWEASLARLLAESPELARARAGVERARCNLALKRAERVPNIEVELGAKYDYATYDALADVGVGVRLPLFDRNQGNIARAEAELIAAEHEVRRVELELRDRLVDAFEQYANARWQVDFYRGTVLPKAEASLEMVKIGRRADELGYLALLTAQRTYSSANLEYLKSLRALWTSSVEIEGMLLRGGLQGPG